MGILQPKIISIVILAVFTFIIGFWMANQGKPYGVVPFNLHKFSALAMIVLLVVTVLEVHRNSPLVPTQWILVVVTATLFIATLTTGGLLSIEREMPHFLTTLHLILPFLTIISSALVLYHLLLRE